MLGAYVGFAIGTVALTAAFVTSFLAQLQPGSVEPSQIPWIVTALVGLAISAFLAGRDVHSVARVLITIDGVGIAAMIVLTATTAASAWPPARRR